jgi:hypothetical protein
VAVVEYVMVPVPEELAPKVLSFLTYKGHPRSVAANETDAEAASPASGDVDAAGDDRGPIDRAFARLDHASRTLVGAVASAALEAEQLSIPEAASRAGVTTREAIGILFEVNNVLAGEGAPPMSFHDVGGPTAGDFTWDSRVVVMTEALARPLADQARSRTTG